MFRADCVGFSASACIPWPAFCSSLLCAVNDPFVGTRYRFYWRELPSRDTTISSSGAQRGEKVPVEWGHHVPISGFVDWVS